MSHTKDLIPFFHRIVRVSLTLTVCMGFASCSNFSATNLAKKSVTSVKSASKSVSKSVAGIIPSRVPIATVRTEDLKKLPTGAERALAWERQLNSRHYASYNSGWVVPANYKAPTLPDERSIPADGGLLPPLHPGQSTTLQGNGELPQ